MGLVSTITRVAKLAPEFLLGTGAEAVGKGIRTAGKGSSIWTKVKAGGKALETDIAKKAIQGGFFKRTLKSLLSTPKAILTGGKVGARAAKIAGKSAAAGAIKGGFKAISKRMPLIGSVLTLAFEAPNIINAFKEGGVGAGLKEIGGAGVELGSMAAGAAIGSAICPGVGTVIGSFVGSIAGMFIRGKTYSDQKAEQEEAQQAQQQPVEYTQEDIQKLQSYGLTPEEIAQIQANGYSIQDVETLLTMEQQQQNIAPQDNTRVAQPYIEQPAPQTTLPPQQQQIQQQTQNQTTFPEFTYQETFQNPYTGTNPYYTGTWGNINSGNPYSNDFHYQELFGTGTGFTNPFDFSQQNQYFKFQGNN